MVIERNFHQYVHLEVHMQDSAAKSKEKKRKQDKNQVHNKAPKIQTNVVRPPMKKATNKKTEKVLAKKKKKAGLLLRNSASKLQILISMYIQFSGELLQRFDDKNVQIHYQPSHFKFY